jgi:hypothetical protein
MIKCYLEVVYSVAARSILQATYSEKEKNTPYGRIHKWQARK